MGQEIEARAFTREDRARFRSKLRRCTEACTQMLDESWFEGDSRSTGFEIELNLVDERGDPALRNAEILEAIDDPAFQTELAQYNIEVNMAPRRLYGSALKDFEDDLWARLNAADAKARERGARIAMVGILPTVTAGHMSVDVLSPNTRYKLLNDQIILARGEDIRIVIDGVDELVMTTDTVAPESACTSTQLHLQVSPDAFAAYWNAAQAIAGPQVAVCANSPFLFGKELWRETRIKLFEQAIDTRSDELVEQGVRPRVWFGERWLGSVSELFDENVRYFSPLLPVCDDEDPLESLGSGRTPDLSELRLHNGTIYRWNRPVYDVVDNQPHLRIENRVLPAGPTVVDVLANAAFYFGLVRQLAEADRPLWSQMSFDAAAENFVRGARHGIGAEQYWPGSGWLQAAELVLRKLLPLAHEGLASWGVDRAQRERLLGVIEQRCLSGQNGAAWQVATFHRIYDRGRISRLDALREMVRRYLEYMSTNAPVHTWPVDQS
ncbi:glutamate--cysteine ligase [Actinopolymorpha sp. B17G11]|uniref:glutamate--cysteine ligase n=1 Tax=unclassified Actinopolymorpha TaxID=2627063 RepID=UPI0032D98FC1